MRHAFARTDGAKFVQQVVELLAAMVERIEIGAVTQTDHAIGLARQIRSFGFQVVEQRACIVGDIALAIGRRANQKCAGAFEHIGKQIVHDQHVNHVPLGGKCCLDVGRDHFGGASHGSDENGNGLAHETLQWRGGGRFIGLGIALANKKHYNACMPSKASARPPADRTGAATAHGNGANDEAYLAALGERVRNARARRGMTRKILARDSGVSERYLAQLETGHGNISIILLRQIARAMDLPVADLVRDGPSPAVALTLLFERLAQLPPDEIEAARVVLEERFGATTRRQDRIALIGLRGAGKTTLGNMLADKLQVPFIELAKAIERDAGMPLTEIFDLNGQASYRRYERRALERALAENPRAVIATGGSLPTEPGTFQLLLANCFTVWVQAAPEAHMERVIAQGDFRPMAGNREAMADLRRILSQRRALYAQADAGIDTTGKEPAASLQELMALAAG